MNSHVSLLPKLMTCYEEQQLNNSEDVERQQLFQLGIKTPSSLATSIVYRGIKDILVAVSKDLSDIIVCTGSSEILTDLVRKLYVIPREKDFRLEQNLIENLTNDTLNKYLKDNRFHFVNIQKSDLSVSGHYCKLFSFSPYPNFTNYNVYTLSAVLKYYTDVCDVLSKGYTKVLFGGKESLVYKLDSRQNYHNTSALQVIALDFKVSVKSLSDIYYRFGLFLIKDLCPYILSDLENDARSGVIKIGDKFYTASLSLAEQYYMDSYPIVETTANKIRDAVSILTSCPADYANKVLVYSGLLNCKDAKFSSIKDLYRYYKDNLDSSIGEKNFLLRLLSPSVINKGSKSNLYRTIKSESVVSYEVADINQIIPSSYAVWGISKQFGYIVVTLRAGNVNDLDYCLRREFIRRFGNLIGNVSYVSSSKLDTNKDIIDLPIELQQRIASAILAGDFLNNFNEYCKLILSTLVHNNAKYYSEDSVKFLMINELARDIKKKRVSGNLCLGDVSEYLYKYIVYCKCTDIDEHRRDLFNKMLRASGVQRIIEKMILDLSVKGKDASSLNVRTDWKFSYSCKSKVATIKLNTLNYECSYNTLIGNDNKVILSERSK